MTRAPNWDADEFELLLQNSRASDDEVAAMLNERTAGAVSVVRNGIHAYHEGQDISMLSQLMQRRLGDATRAVTCPRCGSVV